MLFPKLGTGFRFIDNLWQGFFQGRTYLVTGPASSGKTTFCLQFALPSLAVKEKVIFFTDERPDDLLLRAEGLQFDIFSNLENGNLIIYNFGLEDITAQISEQLLDKTINEIIQIVEKEQPTRLIFDQLTLFLQYKEFETLKRNIKQFIYSCEKFKATTLLTVGEPASPDAENILNFLSSLATATIKLTQANQEERRFISLNARLGYYPVSYSDSFMIQPKIGIKNFKSEEVTPSPAIHKAVTEISQEQKPEPFVREGLIRPEEQPVEEVAPESEPIVESKPVEESDIIEPIESIPEYPIRDLDRDDFTGLFNFDGLLNIVAHSIERKNPFSLVIVTMVKGVDSRAKKLLLSHDLASTVKNGLSKPAPVGRYSDKIIVYLHRMNKTDSEKIATGVEEKALETLLKENETLKGLEIKTEVYSYPDDIQRIHEIEAIVQAGGEELGIK
jgi:KaiC/GvpD/RAD55 family RecA-like ATPase